MKKTMLLISLLALMSLADSCHHEVSGSGNRLKQQRNVGSFNSISADGAFEIEIVCQQPVSLEIEGDDNILPLISTDVSNNALHIKSSSGYSVSTPIKLKISVPNLEGLAVNGAGKIEISGMKNDKFEIDANGAPVIRVTGETQVVEIDANGAGKIDTHRLRASKAIVDSKGVSNVEVHATDQLDVTVAGPSNVTYEGNPTVNKTVYGPGSVEKRTSGGS